MPTLRSKVFEMGASVVSTGEERGKTKTVANPGFTPRVDEFSHFIGERCESKFTLPKKKCPRPPTTRDGWDLATKAGKENHSKESNSRPQGTLARCET